MVLFQLAYDISVEVLTTLFQDEKENVLSVYLYTLLLGSFPLSAEENVLAYDIFFWLSIECRYLRQWTSGQDKGCLMLFQEKWEREWMPYLSLWSCYVVFRGRNFLTRRPIYGGKKGRCVMLLFFSFFAVGLATFVVFMLTTWVFRFLIQLNILEDGLINHPAVGFGESGRKASELRILLAKIEESEVCFSGSHGLHCSLFHLMENVNYLW